MPTPPLTSATNSCVGERRERIEQRLLLLAAPLEQAVVLEQGDVRERRGAARRVAGVRRAVPEDRSARLAPERLGDPFGDHDPAEREIATGHALGEHDHRGLDVPTLDAEPRTEATERTDHRIDHEQDSGSLA